MKTLIDPSKDSLIAAAASRLNSKLTSLLRALRKDPRNDALWTPVREALQDSIVYFTIMAYNSGCAEVLVRPQMSSLIRLRLDATKRAKWVTDEMQAYTLMSLSMQAAEDKKQKKKRLLGSKRASVVAANEMRVAYYTGKIKGWQQNKEARKAWNVSDAHDQDDLCDDNQDDGVIPVGDPFTTGDMYPPAHINCNCTLWLHL